MTIEAVIPICKYGINWQLSPDYQWISDVCPTGSDSYYVKVLNLVDGREWYVDFNEKTYGYLSPIHNVHYTKDSNFLYVAMFKESDGPGLLYQNGSTLVRLNLATGEITEILPLGLYAFSFSITDQLAYSDISGFPHRLNIFNFSNGDYRSYNISGDYCMMGQILWSQDENQIVFQTAMCNGVAFDYTPYSLILLNLIDGSYRPILTSTDKMPYPLEWESEFPIYIDRDSSSLVDDKCWSLNINLGQFQSVKCP